MHNTTTRSLCFVSYSYDIASSYHMILQAHIMRQQASRINMIKGCDYSTTAELTSLGFSRSPKKARCLGPGRAALLFDESAFEAGSGGAVANARSDCHCNPVPPAPWSQPVLRAPPNGRDSVDCFDRRSSPLQGAGSVLRLPNAVRAALLGRVARAPAASFLPPPPLATPFQGIPTSSQHLLPTTLCAAASSMPLPPASLSTQQLPAPRRRCCHALDASRPCSALVLLVLAERCLLQQLELTFPDCRGNLSSRV